MKSYYERIKPHWELEVAAATRAESNADPHLAFGHLERAHILGQKWLTQKVRPKKGEKL